MTVWMLHWTLHTAQHTSALNLTYTHIALFTLVEHWCEPTFRLYDLLAQACYFCKRKTKTVVQRKFQCNDIYWVCYTCANVPTCTEHYEKRNSLLNDKSVRRHTSHPWGIFNTTAMTKAICCLGPRIWSWIGERVHMYFHTLTMQMIH